MKLGQQLKIKQNQSLIMTPQLQQAIKLLQLSNIELADFIDQAQLENPFLQETKEFIDQINTFREEFGTLNHPNYQFQVMGEAAYSPDGIKNLEDLGATEVIVAFRNAYEGGEDERTLEGMIAEINWYAEEVINKSK